MFQAGCTVAKLAAEFQRSPSTIRRTINNCTTRNTTREAPRSGRPRVLTPYTERLVLRAVRAAPKIEYRDLVEVARLVNPDGTLGKAPSYHTLYRVLKKRGLTNPRCKIRLKLTKGNA